MDFIGNKRRMTWSDDLTERKIKKENIQFFRFRLIFIFNKKEPQSCRFLDLISG